MPTITIDMTAVVASAFLILLAIIGFFLRQWLERIEMKQDLIVKDHAGCRETLVIRFAGKPETDKALDELYTGRNALDKRVTALEVKVDNELIRRVAS